MFNECPTTKAPGDAPISRRSRLSLGHWSLVIPAIAGVLAAVHFQSAAAAPILSTNLPPVSPALPEVGFSVIRVFGALALVLALFLAGVWLFKNWQRLALHRGRPAQLQVVEMKHLGGKHALYVVAYQQQRLLLASSPNGVSLVSHLPPGDPAEVEPPAVSSPSFVQVLQQAVQGKQ
jgi:flagellar biogenesis protein FliO